jgi:hypothetical protein
VNWRQFSVAMVQALAWPMVALIALLAYRRRISALLGAGLRRFKAGPLEAEWEIVAEEARVSIQAATVADDGAPTGIKIRHNVQTARDLAYLPAVSASFVRVALEEALTAKLPPEHTGRAHTLKHLLLAARDVGGLSGAAFVVGERVVMLASRGVHDNVTTQQMIELVELTEDFLALLPSDQKQEGLPSRLPSTRPAGERAAARPATSSGP